MPPCQAVLSKRMSCPVHCRRPRHRCDRETSWEKGLTTRENGPRFMRRVQPCLQSTSRRQAAAAGAAAAAAAGHHTLRPRCIQMPKEELAAAGAGAGAGVAVGAAAAAAAEARGRRTMPA